MNNQNSRVPSAVEYWSKPEHVPGPVCWLRTSSEAVALILAVSAVGVTVILNQPQVIPFDDVEKWEKLYWSTDRLEWQPCVLCQI